jgi:hypothetical protein
LPQIVKEALTGLFNRNVADPDYLCKALGPLSCDLLLASTNYVKKEGAMLIETLEKLI